MITAVLARPQPAPWLRRPGRLLARLGKTLPPGRRPVDVRDLPDHLLRDLFPDDAEARRMVKRIA